MTIALFADQCGRLLSRRAGGRESPPVMDSLKFGVNHRGSDLPPLASAVPVDYFALIVNSTDLPPCNSTVSGAVS